MSTESPGEQAERLGRRRARMFVVLAFLVLIQQIEFFGRAEGARVVDHVRFGAWVAMASLALVVLTTGGFLLRGRAVRELLNDELSQANRASALAFAFVAAMVVGIALYPFVDLLDTNPREVLRLVVTTGLAAGLVRFAALERRGLG